MMLNFFHGKAMKNGQENKNDFKVPPKLHNILGTQHPSTPQAPIIMTTKGNTCEGPIYPKFAHVTEQISTYAF